jgi:mRNA-degrading endonuclease RelE of RelBE toxin-antitoxin system
MDKLEKAIAKLPKEHRKVFDDLSRKLLHRDLTGLNIARLKGYKDVFRLKRGRLRIIFRTSSNNLEIIDIGLRSEKTYRDFRNKYRTLSKYNNEY